MCIRDRCKLIADAIIEFIRASLKPSSTYLPRWPEQVGKFYMPLDPYLLKDIGMDCAMFNDSSHEDFQIYQVAKERTFQTTFGTNAVRTFSSTS